MIENIFNQLAIFRGFSSDEANLLRPLLTVCNFSSDHTIFEQGDSAEYLYILTQGEVMISFKPEDGPPLTVAHIQPQGLIGWSAVLGNPCYTSAAISLISSQLVRIRSVDLRAICEEHPEIGVIILDRLADGLSERLRQSHEQVVALLEFGLRTHITPYSHHEVHI